jgi:enoyl-CoA hydratase/carnithine racemase
MLQHLIVYLIVILAALSAAWRIAGIATRLRLLEALLALLPGSGAVHGWVSRLAQRQRAALVSGGCAACAARGSHGGNRRGS